MAKYSRQAGLQVCSGGPYHRVQRRVPSPRQVQGDPLPSGSRRGTSLQGENHQLVGKEGNRKNSGLGEKRRILLQSLFSRQSIGGLSTCFKPKTIKQPCGKTILQDGILKIDLSRDEGRRLGMYNRLTGCFFPRSRSPGTSPFSAIQLRGPGLPIQSPPVRPILRPSNFHPGGQVSFIYPEVRGHKNPCLSRRLDNSGQFPRGLDQGSRSHPFSASINGIPGKLGKISAAPHTTPAVFGGPDRFEIRDNLPLGGEVTVNSHPLPGFHGKNPCQGFTFSQTTGDHEFMHRTNTLCTPTHETHSVVSLSPLEPSVSGPRLSSSDRTVSHPTCPVVASSQEHHGRLSDPPPSRLCTSDHRLLPFRVGGSFQTVSCLRGLVLGAEIQSHKLARTQGNTASPTEVGTTFSCSESDDSLRQQYRSCLSQQGGGDEVGDSLLPHMGDSAVVSVPQNHDKMFTYSGEEEPLGRYAQQEKSSICDRMDPQQAGGQGHFPHVGTPPHRPVCNQSESPVTYIRIPCSRSPCLGSGCPCHRLDGVGSLCLPPNNPDTNGDSETITHPVQSDLNSTQLAQQPLVSDPDVSEKGRALHASSPARPTSPAPQRVDSSVSSVPTVSCVEAVKSRLRKDGFSDRAAAWVAAARRPSTQRSYDSKLKTFQDWARDKGLDPFTTTRAQVADFLEFLFSTQNLSPRTIRSYRCAIGTAHQGWDGVPVGKDPDLSNMIKAFFLQRPPERKLVPNWSLPLVLNSLCKSPFEPLAKADLKWLSLKTAFLVAIASGRRSSTIQALSVDQGHVRENQSGTTLIPAPGFLAKNESINYMAKAIHFPKMSQFSSVPEDRLLCPVEQSGTTYSVRNQFEAVRNTYLLPTVVKLTELPHGTPSPTG